MKIEVIKNNVRAVNVRMMRERLSKGILAASDEELSLLKSDDALSCIEMLIERIKETAEDKPLTYKSILSILFKWGFLDGYGDNHIKVNGEMFKTESMEQEQLRIDL